MTQLAKEHVLKSFVIPFGLVAGVFFAIAIGRETGLIEGDFGKRLAAAMMGLLVAICGNVLPKVARRIEMTRETAAAYASADRLAGFALVVAGIAYAGIWLFAPLERAVFGASLVGLGGFFLAQGLWLFKARPTPDYSAPNILLSKAVAGRMTLFFLLGSLFFAGALFPIDAIWGDRVAQWVAILYSLMLPAVGVPMAVWAKVKGRETDDV
jgi:hypothetical protein